MTDIAWRWRWPEVNSDLLVSQEVAKVLDSHRQRRCDVERGGQLFVSLASPAGLLLALATPSHPTDRAGHAWLELGSERCRQEIESANTKGLRLVGYWHTHPQSIPTISPTDARSFSRFSARHTQQLPHPLAIIVGKSQNPDGIKAWSFRKGKYVEAVWAK